MTLFRPWEMVFDVLAIGRSTRGNEQNPTTKSWLAEKIDVKIDTRRSIRDCGDGVVGLVAKRNFLLPAFLHLGA
jgi:hypothetical protein